jgi:hypothetical protein
MTVREEMEALVDEIEREHCTCGAELDRYKPSTWGHCGIHKRAKRMRQLIYNAVCSLWAC